MFAKVKNEAHWNPVLRRGDDGRIVLYFKVGRKIDIWKTYFCESRDDLQGFLKARGVETLIHYPVPPHLQQAFNGAISRGKLRYGKLPVTEELARTELSIPMGPSMTDDQVSYVIETINAYAR